MIKNLETRMDFNTGTESTGRTAVRIRGSIMDNTNIYQRNGYKNREDYLNCMSEDYGVPLEVVCDLADMMPGEEFDGLVVALEDAEGMFDE